MAETNAAQALHGVLANFERRRPFRAGSLIITVFGDAIVPRGGSLWLGSLLDIMATFRVEPGLVRTALSRLVGDGWFERRRPGRNSFYRLSEKGKSAFADATRRIYHSRREPWDGDLLVTLLPEVESSRRASLREELASRGFGQAAPTVLVRPRFDAEPPEPLMPGVIRLVARLDDREPKAAQALGAQCWRLDDVALAYRRFIAAFEPLAAKRTATSRLGDVEAMQLRILLIHEYRRIILRDPLLPQQLLPADWPGATARDLCRSLYLATSERSERWLDANAKGEGGPLPPPDKSFATRFHEA